MAAKITNWLGTRSHRSHLSGALIMTFIAALIIVMISLNPDNEGDIPSRLDHELA